MLQVGVAPVVDQFETDARLLHLPGLAHLGVVETHEGRRLGGVAEGELFRFANRIAQPVDQGLERLGLTVRSTHQASPPNTSTLLNTQAGDAWPTRITWFGSPLPQYGVPRTLKVLASPTRARLRQKCAEIAAVVRVLHHALELAVLDQLAPFAAELELVARIVDGPRAVGAHQHAVLDAADQLLQRLIARLDVEVGHAVDRRAVPAAGAAVGDAVQAGAELRERAAQRPQQQAVLDQELLARRRVPSSSWP